MEKKTTNQENNETAVSSISLTKNSKGVNIGVKVYDPDPERASDIAVQLFDKLDKKYTVIQ